MPFTNEDSKIYRIVNNNINFIVVFMILIIGFIVFVKLFRPGLPAFEDNPPHFIEAWSLTNYIIPNNLGFSAWVNYDFAGFPIFMYHPYPLGFYIIYILQLIPGISLELAYKLIMYLSYVLPAICLYFVMRSKVGVDYALIPAALWMFNLYALDLVVRGMWSISLSMAPFILLINELYLLSDSFENNDEKYPVFNTIKISVLLAIILLIHSYTFFVSILMIGVLILFMLYFSFFRFKEKNVISSNSSIYHGSKIIISLIVSVILALIIDGFYIINFIKASDWPIPLFSGGSFFTGIISLVFPYHLELRNIYGLVLENNYSVALSLFFRQLLVNAPNYFLLLFGLTGLWFNKDRLFNRSIFFAIIILTLFILGFFNFLGALPFINFLKMQRLLLHFETILLFFVSIGIYKTILNKEKISQNFNIFSKYDISRKNIFVKMSAIIIVILFITSEGYALSQVEKNMFITQDFEENNDILKVFNWVEQNVNEPSRIYYQSTFDDTDKSGIGSSWIMAYANYYTTKPSLGTWSGQMPYPTYWKIQTYKEGEEVIFSKPVKDINDEKISSYLKAYNSKYIVINSEAMKELLNNSRLFDVEASFGRFIIYSLNDYEPGYIQTSDINSSVQVLKFGNELIEFNVSNVELVNISVQYHKYWKAYIDEKPVKINKNEFDLMQLKIPKKNYEESHIILKFEN